MLCLLEPHGFTDPAVEAHVLPIVAWARSVWFQRLGLDELDAVLQLARSKLEGSAEWRTVTGPGQAFFPTCLRLGWIPVDGHNVVMHDGRTINFTRVPPVVVKREVRHAVQAWTWRGVCGSPGYADMKFGAALAGVKSLLAPGSTLPYTQQMSLVAIVTGAIPTIPEALSLDQRRAEDGESAPSARAAHRSKALG